MEVVAAPGLALPPRRRAVLAVGVMGAKLLARGTLALLAEFPFEALADWGGRAAALTLTLRPGSARGSARSNGNGGGGTSVRGVGRDALRSESNGGGGGGGGDGRVELRFRVVGGETARLVVNKLSYLAREIRPVLQGKKAATAAAGK